MLRRLFAHKPITKLSFEPAAPAPDRSGVAAVLIVKNEARNVGEWVRFHRAAGVSHFYVYLGASTDGTREALELDAGDMMTVIPWDQKLFDAGTGRELHNQVLAYAHAMRNFGPSHRWMACIDADEFLVPKQAENLSAALIHLEHCGSVTLPWHNFGRNGHQVPPEGGIVQNYTRRVADPMNGARGVTNFKTIVDPSRVTALKVHSYEIDGVPVTWNDRGEKALNKERSDRGFYAADHVQLNHYYTRSEQELAAKIARGSNQTVEATKHAARVRRNVENIEAEEVEDRCALDFLDRIKAG